MKKFDSPSSATVCIMLSLENQLLDISIEIISRLSTLSTNNFQKVENILLFFICVKN